MKTTLGTAQTVITAGLSMRRRGMPMWVSSQKCPLLYLLSGFSRRGGAVKRPLFQSFVYVRSGSRVFREHRSLGMLLI